jgi:hypothetical protein
MVSGKRFAQAQLVESAARYTLQRAYVALMFDVLARLLVAASRSDPEVRRELAGFPEGLTLGFSVLGASAKMRLRVHDGQLERAPRALEPELDIIFKHISHAFMVLSFQESTPSAFANQRLLTQGDAALSMRLTRCLNRVQAVTLPRFLAERALKAVPSLPLAEKLSLGARLYAGAVRAGARSATQRAGTRNTGSPA